MSSVVESDSSLQTHAAEVIGFGVFTVLASIVTYGLCWHFLDYAGKGPTQGEPRSIFAAYSLSIVGGCSTMCQSLIVHFLAPDLSFLEALFWSSIVRFAMSVPFVFIDISRFSKAAAGETEPLVPKQPKSDEINSLHRYAMLALRGFMGTFGGHLALYWGVQFLYPSEAAALWSTAPFFALIFGYIILGEALAPLTLAMIGAGFAGVLLVIQPIELISWIWTGGLDVVSFHCKKNLHHC